MAAPAQASVLDAMLAPITGGSTPAGDRLPDADLNEIEKARQSDDGGAGVWQRERIDPNWPRVRDLTRNAIEHKSKHLQLAAWYAEAAVRLDALPGLIEGLRLIDGLLERYWDQGLLPTGGDGDYTYRARPIQALNGKIAPLLKQISLTDRTDAGNDYALLNYLQARKAGSEKDLRDKDGNLNTKRQADRQEVIDSGGITWEMWKAAVDATRRASYEKLSAQLNEAWEILTQLVKRMDGETFFGPVEAPSVAEIREVLDTIRSAVAPILVDKRKEEPDPIAASAPVPETSEDKATPQTGRAVYVTDYGSSKGSWDHAQGLVRAGQIQEAIAEMTFLGAQEHGRNRFLHKLDLAEICVQSNRTALAVVILEDLDEQIKSLNLTVWESPELIGRVWGQLYREYQKSGDSSRAAELQLRLCRLDPWQGLKWTLG